MVQIIEIIDIIEISKNRKFYFFLTLINEFIAKELDHIESVINSLC